jgi:epoxyqueuosine reductase QueG
LTVISWVLPATPHTRHDQAAEIKRPSARWVGVRHHGEHFNDALRRHVVDKLSDAGIQAVAPVLAPFWSKSSQGPYAPCSNWSERHAAYAAGLGTFGLCDGLITPVGKAMRTGSVVARVSIAPSPRPYTDRHAYCLFYSHGTCGKCMARCPINAISETGHDKTKCRQYTHVTMNAFIRKTYGISTYACGLCQAGVPCADHIPGPDEG